MRQTSLNSTCEEFIRGRGWRHWPGLCDILKHYILLPPSEAKWEAGKTLLRSTWVCLLPSSPQKVLKFIVLKDNKPSRTEHQQITTLFTDVSQARWAAYYHWKVNVYPEKAKALTPDTRKYLICQIQQPKRSEASAAPCPQLQPVARLKMFSQEGQIHRSNTHTP